MYVFTLMKEGYPVALYKGYTELPEEIVRHEFSTRQLKRMLVEHGYELMRYS